MTTLKQASKEQLEAELESRNHPPLVALKAGGNILPEDLDKIRELAVSNIQSLEENGREVKDIKQWFYEAVMQAIYGPDIWDYINSFYR